MSSLTASDWPDTLNNKPLIGRWFPCRFFSCEKAFGEWPLVVEASGESDWRNASGRFILIGRRLMPGVRVRWRRKSSARHHFYGGRYP